MAKEDFDKDVIVWSAPEIHHDLISHTWRKVLVVLLIGMAFLMFFWQKSILTAVTFFAIAIVTSIHFWQEPKQVNYMIHSQGIAVDDYLHEYNTLESFWINYDPEGVKELSLQTKKVFSPYIKVPLGDQDPVEVRATLLKFLPEEQHQEGFDDLLRRKLGL